MAYPKIHQYKVTLRHIYPPIWRRFQIYEGMTFDDLHLTIQIIMGWEMSHLYAFNINRELITDGDSLREMGQRGRSAEDTPLNELINKEGAKFNYTYDFGDSWDHELVLEKILPFDPEQVYPTCLDGARACPPEDCGGVPGYIDILETLKKPKSKAYKALMEWLDEDFDPEFFDAAAVNEAIAESLEEWDEDDWDEEDDDDDDDDLALSFPPGFNLSPNMIQEMAQNILAAMKAMPEATITGPLVCPQCQQPTQMIKAKMNYEEIEMIYQGQCGRCGAEMSLKVA